MVELKVVLEFACCRCRQSVQAVLKCSGKGLEGGDEKIASVQLACPCCYSVNQVCFEPNGTVRDVSPYRGLFRHLEPSLN